MIKQKKKSRNNNHIAHLQEIYRDHPCMLRVNTLKEQLKQEKLQDKAFYQSIKLERTSQ